MANPIKNVTLGRSRVSGVVATVFGATGFLGRHVVDALGRIGSQVIIPYRGEEYDYNHLKVMGDLGQIVPVKFSVYDSTSLEKAMARSNVVINLIGRAWNTPNFTMWESNALPAKYISHFASKLGVEQLIHVSALGADRSSSSYWARAKGDGEQLMKENFPKATILRPAPVFGRQDRLLQRYGNLLLAWTPLPIFCPNHRFQPIHVVDVADAIVSVVTNKEETAGKVYELGGPETFTNLEFIDYLKKTTYHTSKRSIVDPPPILHKLWEGLAPSSIQSADEVALMRERDLVVSPTALKVQDLGVTPSPLTEVGINYLRGFRPPILISHDTPTPQVKSA